MTGVQSGGKPAGWFEVTTIAAGIASIAEPGHAEHVHSYLIEGEKDVAVLDTGMGVGDFYGLVRSLSDRSPIVLQSHAHWDHVGATAQFERVLVHPAEAKDLERSYSDEDLASWFTADKLRGIPYPEGFDPSLLRIPGATATGMLNHGDRIDLGGRELEIYHTPGHSPGGITIFDPSSGLLFPGDALNLGPLYLFGPQADLAAFKSSLEILVELAGRASAIYPSHYEVPMTPNDVLLTERAFEVILAGKEPDTVNETMEIYEFDRFSFLIEPGALEEMDVANL
ncbi:MAG: MBL fold metallo-hydrolase [Thermomicrobiales bacterium]